MRRLMVLDGSRLLASVVRRLVPAGVAIEEVATFDEAIARLKDDPPDAMIANIGPADLPWQDLKNYCHDHTPRIPVLFESCVHRDADEAGLGLLDRSTAFLSKPYPLDDLRRQLDRLLGGDLDLDLPMDRMPEPRPEH